MNTKLQTAADKINKILSEKTNGLYFVGPSKRALKWFKRYEHEHIFKGEAGAGYSISRTEARWALYSFGLDIDKMLAEHGLK